MSTSQITPHSGKAQKRKEAEQIVVTPNDTTPDLGPILGLALQVLGPVMTIPEAGRILGLGRSAAYEAARRGDIPTIAIGCRALVPTGRLLTILGIPIRFVGLADDEAGPTADRLGASPTS